MKKAKLIFDITETKTEVQVTSFKTGSTEIMDITGSKAEKTLIRLLKQLHEESQVKEIVEATDINKWEQIS